MNNNFKLDISKISKELKLILEIIKTENSSDISKEYFEDIDWESFIQLAVHHRLYPVLYLNIVKVKPNWLPQRTLERLSFYYKKNTLKMLQLSGEMEKISIILMENDIRSIFLKGPLLAVDLYGDISMRTCGDLDILVSISDLEKVNGVLKDIGYIKDEYIQTLLNDWKWRHHHFTYYHPSKGTKVEIHWRLNPAPSKEPTFTELWNRKRKSSFTNSPIFFMGKEDLFFFLVTHGARHGWSRLRWLMDIHQFMKKDLNWITTAVLFDTFQSRHLMGQSLILSVQLFNTMLKKEARELINGTLPNKLAQEAIFYIERIVNLHVYPVPRDIAKYHAYHLYNLLSLQQKFSFILSMLHPCYKDAETLRLPQRFHFLYYPLRPILWIWRKTRKLAYLRGM